MYDYHPTLLAADDHGRLRGLMATLIGGRSPLAALVRRKLGTAVSVLRSDVAPDLVTSGLRVRFKVNGVRTEDRTLVWNLNQGTTTPALSLLRPSGLALLGLSIGQSISFQNSHRKTETVLIEYVYPEYQPSSETDWDRFEAGSASPVKIPTRLQQPGGGGLVIDQPHPELA